jgi:hypothetical protein
VSVRIFSVVTAADLAHRVYEAPGALESWCSLGAVRAIVAVTRTETLLRLGRGRNRSIAFEARR